MDVKNVPETNGFNFPTSSVQGQIGTAFSSGSGRASDRLRNAGPKENGTPEKRAEFQEIRRNQANFLNRDILQSQFGGGRTSLPETPLSPPTADSEAANDINTEIQVSPGRGTEINITDIPRNQGNRVNGPEGFASENNRVTVNGARNTVDLRGGPAAGESAVTFRQTGGADIDNADVNITGDGNTVRFNRGRQTNDTVVVNGDNNEINVGSGADNLNINVAGNNVKINVEDSDPLIKQIDGFSINVDVDYVLVNIDRNGKVEVKGYGGNEDFLVDFNNENKTLNITRYEVSESLFEKAREALSPQTRAELEKPKNEMNDKAGLPDTEMPDPAQVAEENSAV